MQKIAPIFLAAAFLLSSSVAFAQGTGGTSGAAGSAPITNGNSSIGSSIGGPGTSPSTTTGLGNGRNPGIGNMSDPSVRTPGINANGPCNGARSTSGKLLLAEGWTGRSA
jgi:hypothetical protein